jgi:acyl carrier protein
MGIAEKVTEIIAKQAVLSPPDIKPEATIAQLGIDSLGMVEAIFAIEETFDITVPFNANETDTSGFAISTVSEIIDAVTRLVEASPR